MRRLISICFIVLINLLIPEENSACPIPVFRYALEFWESDLYRLEIFYKNSLSAIEEKLVNDLHNASKGNEMKSNLMMRTVNIEVSNQNISQNILKDFSPEDFPLMILRYPLMSGINSVLWSAHLSRENVDLLLNSPVRDNLADKLISDATAVWIFLESGDRRKDQEAFELLNRELSRLEQTLTLPDFELWLDGYKGVSSEKDPKIKFDILRVSRYDPHEELFIKMLMNTEQSLTKFEMEPMVFPIFGRGIVLFAIVGKEINENTIAEAAEFLTGPCSCQAKLLNPGVDLLISRNWDVLVNNIADLSIANPLTGMSDFSSREMEVRLRLESAIYERLGTKSKTGISRDTGLQKLVYIDILGDSRLEDQDNQNQLNEKADEKPIDGKEKEPEYKVSEYSDTVNTNIDIPEEVIDQTGQKMDFKIMVIRVFIIVIGLVLLGGIVLYWKKIK